MNLFKKISISFSFLAVLLLVTPAFALTATVDVDRVLFEYSKAKTAAEQFKTQEESLQKTLIEAQKKIKETTSPVEKKNLENTYDKKLKEQAEKIKTEQLKKLQEIEADVFAAIDKVNNSLDQYMSNELEESRTVEKDNSYVKTLGTYPTSNTEAAKTSFLTLVVFILVMAIGFGIIYWFYGG